MENMKHYKAIKGGEFLEPIDTETDLSGRDLAHKEGEMWRRCHYIKMSDLGEFSLNLIYITNVKVFTAPMSTIDPFA